MTEQLVALGLAFLGLAIPLAVLFYFTTRRAKKEETAAKPGRKG